MADHQFPDDSDELRTIVREETGYANDPDELSQSTLDVILGQAEARLMLETGVSQSDMYSDNGLSFALAAYGKIRAKASVENVPLSSYTIGGVEEVSFESADPDTSQQLLQWAEDVRIGLDASDLDESGNLQIADGAGYVGESYYYE